MKITRWVAVCALSLSTIFILAATLAAPSRAETVLQLGHPTASTSHYGVAAATLADELAKRSNGKFKVVSNPNGAEREMIESAQSGTLDLVLTSTGPVGNFVPEIEIVDIPFLFKDYEHAHAVLDGPIGQDMLKLFPARGIEALAWGENGFRHITNSKRPINTPADAKGLKIRTMENQVHMSAFRQLGVLPTPIAFTELFNALQQGAIDGEENPIPVITSSEFAKVQKYLTLTGHVYSPALILMAKSTYDRLSPDEQKMFHEAAAVAAKAMREKVAAVEATGVAELRAAGMQVVTDVDRTKFQEALEPAYAEYAKKFGKDKIDQIRNYAP